MGARDDGSIADGKLRAGSTDPADVRGLYDEWAPAYDADLDAWEYRTPVEAADLLRAKQPDAGSVLDVGCGTGRVGRALRAAGFDTVVGCDLTPNVLALAEATGAYERLLEVDLQELPTPFVDDAFDALVCVGVLTYIPDTAAALREFGRLVRAGGTIVFSQRVDLWVERDCGAVLAELQRDGTVRLIEQSEPRPYLPGNDEMRDIDVVLCALRAS